MNIIEIETGKKNQFIDITSLLEREVSVKNIDSAVLLIFVPHTTAAVAINENYDPAVTGDIISSMQRLIPENFDYNHSEGNSSAHIKSTVFGNELLIPVSEKKLMLGRWQAVFFCEFDGPRNRKIYTEFIKTV